MRVKSRDPGFTGIAVFLFAVLAGPSALAEPQGPATDSTAPAGAPHQTRPSEDGAHRITEELTLGALGALQSVPRTPFLSNRLGGALDVSEQAYLRLDTTLTHYAQVPGTSATNVFQVLFGGTWEPNDHLSFDGDVYLSPRSSTVTRSASAPAQRSVARTSSVGAAIGGEYDTATDGDLDTAVDLTVGLTRYTTTQATRYGRGKLQATGPTEEGALAQGRVALGATETILRNTDVGFVGTYYFYDRDPMNSGYYGANVFGRGAVSDGIPLEPMRYSLRPTLLERLGSFTAVLSFQYAEDVHDSGHSLLFGAKLQYRFSRAAKAWLSANHQVETLPTSEVEKIDSGSVGATFYF